MFEGANLKLDRAAERIAELNELLRESPPFKYVLETDAKTGERATFAKQNKALVDRAAIISGDAAHNIRSALDHAYWEIVSPLVTDERARKAIQFPFSKTAARLDEAIKNRLAHGVSQRFFDAIQALRPHAEQGGNRMLYLIDQLDAPDKHRILTPMADYTLLTGDIIHRQVPDFPQGFLEAGFGQNRRDVGWRVTRVQADTLGTLVPPTTCVFEKELDVPVEVVFAVADPDFYGPAIPTLSQLVNVAKEAIEAMGRATI